MEHKHKRCKKLKFRNSEIENSPTILIGVVLEDSNDFLKFRTAKKEYLISKNMIISIEDTRTPFKEDYDGQG